MVTSGLKNNDFSRYEMLYFILIRFNKEQISTEPFNILYQFY